jgi:hypothetical protein
MIFIIDGCAIGCKGLAALMEVSMGPKIKRCAVAAVGGGVAISAGPA